MRRKLEVGVAGLATVSALPVIGLLSSAIFMEDLHSPFVDAGVKDPFLHKKASVYKLRTMIHNAKEHENLVQQYMEEHGLTSLGEFKRLGLDWRVTFPLIRKLSLDELPQLINVVKGDLSLIGFRPLSSSDWQYLHDHQEEEPFSTFIHQYHNGVKPGVLGFYGMYGRSNLDFKTRIELDVMYAENASLRLDREILLGNVRSVIKGDGAI